MYEELRPYGGTTIVMRAPAAGCMGPADQYLGLLAAAMGDLALAEVHFEAALRLARRMRSEPFIVAAEVELARTLRQRGRDGDEERVAILLRHAEESAVALGCTGSSAGRRNRADPGLVTHCVAAPPRRSVLPLVRRSGELVVRFAEAPDQPTRSALRKPGISVIASNSRGPMISTWRSVVAVTVALRGAASIAASSPK